MSHKRIDIMLDIETLGKGDDATVFQISAIAFNLFTGQYLDEIPYFNEVADIEKNNILNVDGSTLKWWLRTDKQLLTELLHKGEKSTNEILVDFYEWLLDRIKDYGKENVYLWGYGILFDNRIIKSHLESLGFKYPVLHRNNRDVHTILELASHVTGISEKEIKEKIKDESLVKHNAIDDVKRQVNLVIECYKLITKGS